MSGSPVGGTRGGVLVGEAHLEEVGAVGEDGVGEQFEEGHEDEGSLVHAGVGHGERSSSIVRSSIRRMSMSIVRGPQRTSRMRPSAASTRLTAAEEIERLQRRVDLGDDVQEVGLLAARRPDRSPNTRGAKHRDARFGGEQVDRVLQRREPVAEVRAQPEEGRHRPLPVRGWQQRRRRRCPAGRQRWACGRRR